mmetsp:Transcript_65739/g.181879  ORF Transcript_65739/g.181879 Transcript_65739/m.181879 type:complete len:363 (+) Transcript_65739:516-1604(+)
MGVSSEAGSAAGFGYDGAEPHSALYGPHRPFPPTTPARFSSAACRFFLKSTAAGASHHAGATAAASPISISTVAVLLCSDHCRYRASDAASSSFTSASSSAAVRPSARRSAATLATSVEWRRVATITSGTSRWSSSSRKHATPPECRRPCTGSQRMHILPSSCIARPPFSGYCRPCRSPSTFTRPGSPWFGLKNDANRPRRTSNRIVCADAPALLVVFCKTLREENSGRAQRSSDQNGPSLFLPVLRTLQNIWAEPTWRTTFCSITTANRRSRSVRRSRSRFSSCMLVLSCPAARIIISHSSSEITFPSCCRFSSRALPSASLRSATLFSVVPSFSSLGAPVVFGSLYWERRDGIPRMASSL